MQSLNQLVYDVINIAYGGFASDDNQVSERQVAYWVNQTRETLASQILSDNKAIPESLIQHLECVQLDCVDTVECCEISSGERILKSTQRLPQTIQRNGRNTVLAVSSQDKLVGFSETNYFRQRTNKYSKYTGSKPRWFIKDNYIYVINEKVLEYVSVSGIFEDPTEAIMFSTCEGEPCFTWDSPYPVTGLMARNITNIILKERFNIALNAPNDTSNDTRGKTTPPNAND